MKSIAVTKPDMGVLSRQRLPLSPFGALAQAFGEELLARAEQEEGRWPYVPLELLEEGEEALPPPTPSRVELHVDLQLVLEALRREEGRTEQHRATERIVERILRLQEERTSGPAVEKAVSQTVIRPFHGTGIIHQKFHQSLTQNIHVVAADSRGQVPTGALARQAEAFSRNLQLMREEGRPVRQEIPLPQCQAVVLPVAEQENSGMTGERVASAAVADRRTSFMKEQQLPREELTLLEEAGREAEEAQSQVFRREVDRLGRLVEHTVEEAVRAGAMEQTPRTADRPKGHGAPERLFRGDQRAVEDLPTGAVPRQGARTMSAAEHPLPAYGPVGLTHRTEEKDEKGRAEQPEPSRPDRQSAGGAEKKEDAVVSRSFAPTARDIRMGGGLLFEDVEKSTAARSLSAKEMPQAELKNGAAGPERPGAQPAGRDETGPTVGGVIPVYGPMELEHRSEREEEPRETAEKSHAEQPGQAERAYRQMGDRTEESTAAVSQTAQQRDMVRREGLQTARDIRVNVPPAGRDETGPVADDMLSAYGLVELEHRREQETETGERAEKSRPEQAVQADRPRRRMEDRAEESAAAVSQTAGRRDMIRREGVQTARDIRVNVPREGQEEKIPTADGIHPAYGPVELEHRREQEAETGERAEKSRPEQVGQTDRPRRQMEDREKESAAAVSPTARDIRVNIPPVRQDKEASAADHVLPAYSPVELEHRREQETETGERAEKSRPEQAGQTDRPHRQMNDREKESTAAVSPTARDIRVSTPPGGQEEKVPTADGMLPAYGPVELEHRREQEAETGERGEKSHPEQAGQTDRPHRQMGDRTEESAAAVSPTARDIRVNVPPVRQDKEASAADHVLPAYSPVELEHRREQEAETWERAEKSRPEQAVQTDRPHRQMKDRAKESAAAVSPTARDIRVSTQPVRQDKEASAADPVLSAYGSVELEHRSGGEAEQRETGRSGIRQTARSPKPGQGGTAAASDILPELEKQQKAVSGFTPTRNVGDMIPRDIRINAEKGSGEKSATSQLLPAQGPLELTYRAEESTERNADRFSDGPPAEKRSSSFRKGRTSVTARDIRTGGEISQGDGREKRSVWSLPPAGLILNQPGGESTTSMTDLPLTAERGTEAVRSHAGTVLSPMEPVTLTYGPVQGAAGGEGQATARDTDAPEQEESEYVRSLPDWARRFLKNSWNESGPSGAMGVAREIAVLPQPEEQVQWTAPNYRPPEAAVVYREKEKSVQPSSGTGPQISETELQRTADRVYRMIEERIRRERRRLGL